ncbi:MAG: DNA internalization-related competence protein ComEC/Rec2 [Gammaproteobacteria bacterium]
MRYSAVLFLAGATLPHALAELPPAGALPWLALPLVLMWRRPRAARLLLVCAAGFAWTWGHAAWRLADRLDPALEGAELTLHGTVVSLPGAPNGLVRFDFEVGRESRPAGMPSRIRLSWYRAETYPKAGERWQLVVRLKAPRGFMNPGGFDYEAFLFRERIGATGYVRSSPLNRRLAPAGGERRLLGLRRRIVERLAATLGERPALGVLSGLSVGAEERISREQWDVFAATGTSHLISISGLHIALVAMLVFFFARRMWRALPGLSTRIAAADAGACASLVAALAYSLLAGFTVPTRRALIMLCVVLGLMLLRRGLRPAQHLCVALWLVVLFDPLATLSPGFWLSFAAVAVIAYGIAGRVPAPARAAGRFGDYCRIQWLVFVGLAPLTMWIFGQAPLVAPLVNLFLIPLYSFAVIPLTLAGVALLWPAPAGAEGLLRLAAWLFEQTWPAVEWAASLDLSFGGQPPFWALAAAVPAVLWLTASGALPGRVAAVGLMLPLMLARPSAPLPGDYRLTLLDVGQGLAAVVRTHEHVLVYDAGPSFLSGSNTGMMVVLPYLASQGIRDVDVLVVSHEDNDHAGGARALLDAFPRARLVAGARAAAVAGRHATRCKAGVRWRWDGIEFAFLHPPGDGRFAGNDASCVLRVRGQGGSTLLPGDIERPAESFLSAGDAPLEAAIVVVPHHGSATSSSTALIEATGAHYALVSAGYRNRWAFPKPEVSRRWTQSGAQLLGTAHSGAITFDIEAGRGISQPRLHRREAKRYWTAP